MSQKNETGRSDRKTFVLLSSTPNKKLFAESTAAPCFKMPWTSINRGGQDHTLRQKHYYRHKVPQSIFQLVISHFQTASLAPPLMSLSSVPLSLPASNISLDAAAEDVSLGAAVLRAAVGVSIIVDASN